MNEIINMTNDQKTALAAIKSGRNVFITGCGGTGKSVVIRTFVEETEKNVIVCAPTGKAAINVDGITVHKLIAPPERLVAPYMSPSDENELMDAADVIIVDEVSMLRIDTFEYLVRTMDASKERTGKEKQLVVIGDMHQLPPVITTTDRELLQTYWGDVGDGFAFRSEMWDDCDFINIMMTEQMRQDGSSGTVKHIYGETVEVTMDTGEDVVVGYYTWYNDDLKVNENGRIISTTIGSFSQIPLSLGYAITMHKSQGMTLSAANIIPSCFAAGQLYVAMSRVKTAAGIYIEGEIRPEDIKASKEVRAFYDGLIFDNDWYKPEEDKITEQLRKLQVDELEYGELLCEAEEYIHEFITANNTSMEDYITYKLSERFDMSEGLVLELLEMGEVL